MTRSQVRQRLEMAWWRQLGLTLAPLLVICVFFGSNEPIVSVLAIPLFVAGLGSMFFSLKPFGAYQRALAATQTSLDTPDEPAAWLKLAAVRRMAFLIAGLPAWIAAVAVLFGLHPLPVCLLMICSVVLLMLYRIPRKLS
ncbi:MFS transporter [Pseudomonas sp. CDFA 602]|uniref:MFS transporter n=1 Tax=Pseudomonas californiensis TaxID=2829823 RepID=UPI001E414222|nr:MFS transporter [Pseudomonas californiensis]MCD5994686.1 MFS transporter [Pseudomonas californiensis]MCD6000329.1 MFS transporter [Pseudomonas californiensis]